MAVTPRLALPVPQSSDGMNVSPPAFFTTWSNVDPAIGPTVCTSSTRPGSPYACQWIWQSDTNEHFIYDPTTSAWVKMSSNPTGIIGINSTTNHTVISAMSTRFLMASINGMTVEQNRNYRIHVEGTFNYTGSGSMYTAPTQSAQAAIHVATSGSISTGSTIQQTQYTDAWPQTNASGANAQISFAFDTTWNSGSGAYLSAGWSFEVTGTQNSGSSNFYTTNTLTYVERA